MATINIQTPKSYMLLTFVLLIFMIGGVNGVEIRKLDETGSSDQSIKCGGCSSCGNPSCYSSPPPPPPVLPPPPPKKQSPATPYCPPPPSSPSSAGFIYMTAPPGELYPVDHNYSGSSKTMEDAIKTFLLGFGLLASLLMI